MANLTDFKTKIGYGIRPNLFKVTIPDPTGLSIGSSSTYSADFTYLCRSAAIPASSIGTVEVPYRGRVIKLPGDRTFESWTTTIFADPTLDVRGFLEKWMDKLNEHRSGAGYGGDTADVYTADITVQQLQRDNGSTSSSAADTTAPHRVLKTYRFINAWPSNVSSIDLSYDNNNSVAEFTCEWQYDWWEVTDGTSGVRAGNGSI